MIIKITEESRKLIYQACESVYAQGASITVHEIFNDLKNKFSNLGEIEITKVHAFFLLDVLLSIKIPLHFNTTLLELIEELKNDAE